MIETVVQENNPTFDIPSALVISKEMEVGDNINMLIDYEVIEVNENGVRIKINNIQTRIQGRKI